MRRVFLVLSIASVAGPAYFVGPTGGYLAGFLAAIFFLGFVLNKQPEFSWPVLFGLMIIGHFIILGLGVLWLAYGMPSIGISLAIVSGVLPFLIGSILKSAMAACIIKSFQKV